MTEPDHQRPNFLRELRNADPLFWLAAALVLAILLSRWLFAP